MKTKEEIVDDIRSQVFVDDEPFKLPMDAACFLIEHYATERSSELIREADDWQIRHYDLAKKNDELIRENQELRAFKKEREDQEIEDAKWAAEFDNKFKTKEETNAYLIAEGYDPEKLADQGVVFVHNVMELVKAKKELATLRELLGRAKGLLERAEKISEIEGPGFFWQDRSELLSEIDALTK